MVIDRVDEHLANSRAHQGLCREQLESLAKKRKSCDHFDSEALSSDGFMVKCSDRNVQLPGGEVVADGTTFRDDFHFWVCRGFFLCVSGADSGRVVQAVSSQGLVRTRGCAC